MQSNDVDELDGGGGGGIDIDCADPNRRRQTGRHRGSRSAAGK